MDVLSDVLRVVRLSGAVFFTAEFSSPWAIASPIPEALAPIMAEAQCIVLFHVLIDGECLVECKGHPTVRMEAGDVIVFPHSDPHIMGSRDALKATPLNAIFTPGPRDELPEICYGGGGSRSRLVCGYLNCDQRFNPLIGALPTMLLVRSCDDYAGIEAIDASGRRPTAVPQGTGTWLGTTINFTINEARAARPGNTAMLGHSATSTGSRRLACGAQRPARRQSVEAAARQPRAELDGRRVVARGGDFPFRPGRAVH